MAAHVLRDGHGQDVRRLLRHGAQDRRVAAAVVGPGDGKLEGAAGLAALTEHTQLEALLVLC